MTEQTLTVIHPLDDAPEAKLDPGRLGPMTMTPQLRWSLFVLRGYLILMLLLVLVRVLELAGVVKVALH